MEGVRKKYLMCIHCDPPTHHESIDAINTHLFRKHPSLDLYKCGSCKKDFLHKTSLIRHFSQTHNDLEESQDGSSSDTNIGGPQSGIQIFDADVDTNDDDDVGNVSVGERCQAPEEVSPFNMKDEAAFFLMNLRSSGNITHASVYVIQEHVEKLLTRVLFHARNQTGDFLKKCGISENNSSQFLDQTFNVSDPFDGLKNVEDQMDYFSTRFGMVQSEDKLMGSRVENRFDRQKRMFLPAQVLETFQYISLIGTLTLIVRIPYLRKLIESEQPSSDGTYRSYVDGSDYKLNPFFKKFPNAIRIVFYQDDLEVANVLGSKDVIHKLGCFYFYIQNFPAEINSLLSSIFLLALAYAEDLKKQGAFSKVLTPLHEEVKQLMSDEGVTIALPEGGSYVLRACLVCFCGDSLAAHAILGFLSPSADRFCRRCMISKGEFAQDSTFVGQPRTSAAHKQHVDAVLKNPSLAKSFGVKEKSLLTEMMRVPEDSAFDALHDLVGVIAMDLKLVLYEFICVRKLFSVFDFNSKINMFDYGKPDIRNKPSPNFMYKRLVDKGHTLKQSGAQTFCLLRIFPFIITGVEEKDPFLELVFLLQDIVKIINSFEVKDANVLSLDTLVPEHNRLFHNIFIAPLAAPANADNANDGVEAEENADELDEEEDNDDDEEGDEDDNDNDEVEEVDEPAVQPQRRRRLKTKRLKKAINKLHHLCHYSQQIREKGPAIRLWCARLEARHRILRKHAGVQSNFKNVPKTMARVYQLSTFGAILSKTGPRGITSSKSGAQCCLVKSSTYKDLLLANGYKDNDEIQIVDSAEVCGEEYSCGLFVGLKHTGLQPVFAVIVDVIEKMGDSPKVSLVVAKCCNSRFSSRFNAYRIDNAFDKCSELVDVKDLVNHRPIAAWTPCMETGDEYLYLAPRSVDY